MTDLSCALLSVAVFRSGLHSAVPLCTCVTHGPCTTEAPRFPRGQVLCTHETHLKLSHNASCLTLTERAVIHVIATCTPAPVHLYIMASHSPVHAHLRILTTCAPAHAHLSSNQHLVEHTTETENIITQIQFRQSCNHGFMNSKPFTNSSCHAIHQFIMPCKFMQPTTACTCTLA